MSEHGGEEQPHVVVRDRRRIDPQTGEARPPEVEDDDESSTGRHAAEDASPRPRTPGADDAATTTCASSWRNAPRTSSG